MRLVAVGDNCIDNYAALGQAYPGGNAVNVAVNVVRDGGFASYVGVVGDDDNGTLMLDALAAENVDTSHVHVLPGLTAVTQVEIVSGERVFGDYDEGILEHWTLTDDDLDFIGTHDVMATALWGKIENDLDRVRETGVTVAFDFATEFDHRVVDAAIERTDIAFFSADEPDNDRLRDRMSSLRSRGPRLLVVTLGEHGSVALDETGFHHHGIVPTEVADTMGAGDSYIGGFLWATIEGKPLLECMSAGAASASKTLRLNGAW